jgi:FeS assembly protein IscX
LRARLLEATTKVKQIPFGTTTRNARAMREKLWDEFGFDLHWLRRLHMAREIDWTDAEEIGILLQEKYPETEPYSVRFTDLHKYVIGLPGFVGDPAKSNEGILEAIQTAWNEEWADAK